WSMLREYRRTRRRVKPPDRTRSTIPAARWGAPGGEGPGRARHPAPRRGRGPPRVLLGLQRVEGAPALRVDLALHQLALVRRHPVQTGIAFLLVLRHLLVLDHGGLDLRLRRRRVGG